MTDDQKSGAALILGTFGSIVTMAVHPTGGAGPLTEAQISHLGTLSALAHTLAMISFLALFFGALGLTARLAARERPTRPGDRDRYALAGLVVYAFAGVALLLATAVSGFIVPVLWRHMLHDSTVNLPLWHIVIDAVVQFNQAFARIYSVAASGAILLWSVSALRNGGLGRGLAILGCILAPLLMALIAVGHLRVDVHGMAAIVLAHSVWLVAAGVQLRRQPEGQRA